jgi:hypothetical protein
LLLLLSSSSRVLGCSTKGNEWEEEEEAIRKLFCCFFGDDFEIFSLFKLFVDFSVIYAIFFYWILIDL